MQLIAALHGVAETVRSVLLIGHNPGMHDLALTLAGPRAMRGGGENERALAHGFPTGALAEFVVPGSWCGLARRWCAAGAVPDAHGCLRARAYLDGTCLLMELELVAGAETVARIDRG